MNKDLQIREEFKKEIQVSEINGRTTIIYNKTKLKGKATSKEVLDVALVAAKMQIEKYIDKLSRGAPLDKDEVKALLDLANISKINLPLNESEQSPTESNLPATEELKQTLYKALTEKLQEKS